MVYLGVNQTPEMIVHAAMHEDVDAIGISSHASNYNQILELVELLGKNDLKHVKVFCGGNVPRHKVLELEGKGVAEVFPPGSSGKTIVDAFRNCVRGG